MVNQANKYVVPTYHPLRWIEYLPEAGNLIGNLILDELKWIYETEAQLTARRRDLIVNIRRIYLHEEIERAKHLAKDRPGTNPTAGELRHVASPNRVGTEG